MDLEAVHHIPVFQHLEAMKLIREAQKEKNKDYDATACLQLQVIQICRLAGADCHPSIGESLINS